MAKPESWSVSVDPVGFSLRSASGQKVVVPWVLVSEVHAYKLDLLTTDEVRLDISVAAIPSCVTISEEMSGFSAFVSHAETELGFLANWWVAVVKPAFASNKLLLFRRA
jgi:hypothetical protein